jgi:hypothetical protein
MRRTLGMRIIRRLVHKTLRWVASDKTRDWVAR